MYPVKQGNQYCKGNQGCESENQKKHTKTLCGRNETFLNPTAGDTYTVGLHLPGLTGTARHPDMHKIRITGFLKKKQAALPV